MSHDLSEIAEIHWLMDMLQSVDVGLIVLDKSATIQLWNSFLENHSGITSTEARNSNIFKLFPDLDEIWLRHHLQSVHLLHTRAYSNWEHRPYLLKFSSYRPITSGAPHMYQNITLMPLLSVDGEVNHTCILIYDVTDTAISQQALHQSNRELERLSQIDGLTGLFNRSTWEGHLQREYKRCRRSGHQASLVMFDIDHFKNVNDIYGHQAGDEAIRRLATTLKYEVRETDIAGRYGGEEFSVLLIDTPLDNAMVFCERLRKSVEAITIVWDKQEIRFTISLGIASLSKEHSSGLAGLKEADEALYYSKEHGRNRTTRYTPTQ